MDFLNKIYAISKENQYKLSLSLGYDVYDNKSQMSSEQYIKHLDSLMYKEKKRKKKSCNIGVLFKKIKPHLK